MWIVALIGVAISAIMGGVGLHMQKEAQDDAIRQQKHAIRDQKKQAIREARAQRNKMIAKWVTSRFEAHQIERKQRNRALGVEKKEPLQYEVVDRPKRFAGQPV